MLSPDRGSPKPKVEPAKKSLPPVQSAEAKSSKPNGASRFKPLTLFAPSQEYVFRDEVPNVAVLKRPETSAAGTSGANPLGVNPMGVQPRETEEPESASASTFDRGKLNPMGAPVGFRSRSRTNTNVDYSGETPQGPVKMQPRKVAKQLTWEEYNALEPRERAAVDFNTLLVRAREKDLNADYDPYESQEKNYQRQVEEIFGKDSAASSAYAPETVAVLSELGWTAKGGESLDDFLSLKASISAKELKNFTPKTDPNIYNSGTVQSSAGVLEQQLTQATMRLQEQMAKSGQILQNFNAAVKAKVNLNIVGLGGDRNKFKVARGYEGIRKSDEMKDLDALFAEGYSALLRPDVDAGAVWTEVNSQLNDRQKQQFVNYLDSRSRQEISAGVNWNKDSIPLPKGLGPSNAFAKSNSFKFMSPEEMRERLGLDKREG